MFYRVGIIGFGYIGLPLILAFCKDGYKMIGFDIDQGKVEKLSRGESYVYCIPSMEIKNLLEAVSF